MKSVTIQHDCKEELNNAALRATPARIAILRLLESTREPVDVATIAEHLQEEKIATDPATIFRIVHMFTQKGIATQIQFQEGKTRYELANKDDHHHLLCEQCGRVEDIRDTVIPALEKHIEAKNHFTVKRHSLEFFGLCAACQK